MAKNYNGSYWPREIRAILAGDATDNFLLLDLCVHKCTKKKKRARKWDKGAVKRDSETFCTRIKDVPPKTVKAGQKVSKAGRRDIVV